MNENTYAKLEYEKIIDLLVNECSADLTKEKARELKPVTERKIVEMWQEETSEGVLMRRMEPNIPLGGIIDIRNVLRKIEIGRHAGGVRVFANHGCVACLQTFARLFVRAQEKL